MNLTEDHLKLSEVKSALSNHSKPTDGSTRVGYFVMSNFTANPIEPYLKYWHMNHARQTEIHFSDLDNPRLEIFDSNSELYSNKARDSILLINLDEWVPDFTKNKWNSNDIFEEYKSLLNRLIEKTHGQIFINSFIYNPFIENGFESAPHEMSIASKVLTLNSNLLTYIKPLKDRITLLDWNKYTSWLGFERTYDNRKWNLYRIPFTNEFYKQIASDIYFATHNKLGGMKKCVILDCDNTLWGGIIGEDGISDIKLDSETIPGRFFYQFQEQLVELNKRGILLSLCSKNNPDDVFDVLDKHPFCLLKREHFSAIKINWENKAQNILEIGRSLNLGLDSFIFIDDSNMECDLIRNEIPGIEVLQVPSSDRLYNLPHLLNQKPYFKSGSSSIEDTHRVQMYSDEFKRQDLKKNFTNIDEFIKTLKLKLTIRRNPLNQVPRIAQLTQKTNQFNFTSKRHSENTIADFISSTRTHVYTAEVEDKFGKYGITGVIVVETGDAKVGNVEIFLMSCRILGRKIELYFLNKVIHEIQKEFEIKHWRTEYIPSLKNQQLAEFWPRCGLTLQEIVNETKIYEGQFQIDLPKKPLLEVIYIDNDT